VCQSVEAYCTACAEPTSTDVLSKPKSSMPEPRPGSLLMRRSGLGTEPEPSSQSVPGTIVAELVYSELIGLECLF
jgi:hypothetical protein